MENNIEEESIDLGRLAHVAWAHKPVVGGLIVGCTLLAAGVSFTLPPTYESSTLVQMRSAGNDISGLKAAAAAMGFGGGSSSGGSAQSYIELMKSRAVLDPIIDDLPLGQDPDKRPDAAGFAKSSLKIENTKQTNLITVTGKGPTPEEAQFISQSVVDNFLLLQTEMNGETQSMLVSFLNDRIAAAKEESDAASDKFAAYSREHKLYAPDEQMKNLLSQSSAYDKAIADMEVQQKSAAAEFDSADAQLGQQRSGSKAYNINDNSTVQSIRSQIVSAEVNLVGMEQKYTDNHPDVIAAQKKLADLRQSLTREVSAVVESDAASLNPTQSAMLQKRALADAQKSAAAASAAALREKRDAKESELTSYPEDMVEYMRLKQDADIKQQIYTNLVGQCENNKIKEAMESLDIQVVDEADLPKHPSGPRKKLIAAIGFVIGCLLAFGYSLVCYKKEEA